MQLTPIQIKEREQLDNKLALTASVMDAKLDEGIRFARWLSFDVTFSNKTAAELKELLAATDYFNGTVMGKPATVFFFIPLFD